MVVDIGKILIMKMTWDLSDPRTPLYFQSNTRYGDVGEDQTQEILQWQHTGVVGIVIADMLKYWNIDYACVS